MIKPVPVKSGCEVQPILTLLVTVLGCHATGHDAVYKLGSLGSSTIDAGNELTSGLVSNLQLNLSSLYSKCSL